MRFVVVDLETTRPEPVEAHVIEWAVVIVEPEWFGQGGVMTAEGGFVRPPVPIPPETSAIHHIIDADVAQARAWQEEHARIAALLEPSGVIAVAHSCELERAMLNQHPCPTVPWLDTYKAALRVWPDAPAHSNEALRYWLGLGTGRSQPQPVHSAAHDAGVTAQLLGELLKRADPADMVRWTDEPAMLPRCPIGEYRGYRWTDIQDASFLEWILYRAHRMREDIRFCARMELERRAAAEAEETVDG